MLQTKNTRERFILISPFLDDYNDESIATSPTIRNSNILSPGLRANFEELRSLQQCDNIIDSNRLEHRPQLSCRPPKRRNLGNSNLTLTLDDSDQIGKEEKQLSNNSSDEANNLATTTYFMIQGEISHMVNKIAELEALLSTQSENDNEGHMNTNVVEPEHQQSNSNNDLDNIVTTDIIFDPENL